VPFFGVSENTNVVVLGCKISPFRVRLVRIGVLEGVEILSDAARIMHTLTHNSAPHVEQPCFRDKMILLIVAEIWSRIAGNKANVHCVALVEVKQPVSYPIESAIRGSNPEALAKKMVR
jgi:hypothetical protein